VLCNIACKFNFSSKQQFFGQLLLAVTALSTQLKVLEFSVCITQNILAEDDAKTLLCDKHQANTTTPLAVQQ
jgi:hypothetical protein